MDQRIDQRLVGYAFPEGARLQARQVALGRAKRDFGALVGHRRSRHEFDLALASRIEQALQWRATRFEGLDERLLFGVEIFADFRRLGHGFTGEIVGFQAPAGENVPAVHKIASIPLRQSRRAGQAPVRLVAAHPVRVARYSLP